MNVGAGGIQKLTLVVCLLLVFLTAIDTTVRAASSRSYREGYADAPPTLRINRDLLHRLLKRNERHHAARTSHHRQDSPPIFSPGSYDDAIIPDDDQDSDVILDRDVYTTPVRDVTAREDIEDQDGGGDDAVRSPLLASLRTTLHRLANNNNNNNKKQPHRHNSDSNNNNLTRNNNAASRSRVLATSSRHKTTHPTTSASSSFASKMAAVRMKLAAAAAGLSPDSSSDGPTGDDGFLASNSGSFPAAPSSGAGSPGGSLREDKRGVIHGLVKCIDYSGCNNYMALQRKQCIIHRCHRSVE